MFFRNSLLSQQCRVMNVSAQRIAPHLWLLPVVVFVFFAGLHSPVCWAESQQESFEPEFDKVPDSSEGDAPATGFIAGLPASSFLSSFPGAIKTLPLVTGSDAYPSIIIHGPPARGCPA